MNAFVKIMGWSWKYCPTPGRATTVSVLAASKGALGPNAILLKKLWRVNCACHSNHRQILVTLESAINSKSALSTVSKCQVPA